ncbi:NAD glycohydrolase inhibitor [uncultured Streptococcus sp.]|uniref:NAD glycohydrolase inhibitor n=1 Tax=uncultured Streptococcus sp. TaxID=83427 RepID=UPI003211AC2B
MKTYKLKNKENYQNFVKDYREIMKEGKEAEVFLGTEARYRFRQRDSYELDSTDIGVLIEYCLYPLYVEGDRDIARRTFEILKDFSLSNDLMKLKKVTQYISNQKWFVTNYYDIPFVIETDELVRNIIESISKLSDEQKRTYTYERLCNVLDRSPLYRQCDEEKVEKILKEFKEKYYNPPKVVETIKTVEKIELDVTSIDAMGVSDDHLELLLIDENKWIESLEEEHLLKLQEKLNNYIYFLESKQYVERYGDKFDKKVIHITFQYSPSDNGLAFLAAVQKLLQPTDMSLKVELPEW